MQLDFKSLALFCGSQEGNDARYVQVAAEFGARYAELGLTLYYGGARLGLMRAAAEASMQRGGRVVGIMPQIFTDSVVVADNITEMVRVKSMSERKQLMERVADAFVALPGSFGTMDELFEILTDAQLGLHQKPVVILNAFGYYDGLLNQLSKFEEAGFLRPFHHGLLLSATSVDEVFARIATYENPNDEAWLAKHLVR